MSNPLKIAAMHWHFARVRGVRIQIPWDSNLPQYGRYHYGFAKATLPNIIAYVTQNCPHRTKAEIEKWMKGGNEIDLHTGIDCNGFVYRILDEACRVTGAPNLYDTLGTTCEYTALDTLTPMDQIVMKAKDVRAGDTLRFNKGWHSGVVIETVLDFRGKVKEIWYAHSSFTRGPHIGVVQVGNEEKPLNDKAQNWVDAMWDSLTNNGIRDRYFNSVHRTPFYRGPRPAVTWVNDLRVAVEGRPVEVEPFILGGRTLCQVRPLAEALGATVTWDAVSESVTFMRGSRKAFCQLGSEVGTINGDPELLDEPPMLYNDRTVVPLRFVAGALGYAVSWDNDTRTVNLRQG